MGTDSQWIIPEIFSGETVFILGGGPSIRDFNFSRLRGRRVIAINNAGTEPDRAPWADVLYWSDMRWFAWNYQNIHRHTGALKVTRRAPHIDVGCYIKVLRYNGARPSLKPDAVGGICSGSCAINLAFLAGSRRIVLLGFDMVPGNWHDQHEQPSAPRIHAEKYVPNITKNFAPILANRGCEVINTNPASALRCFPFATIESLL